MRINLGTKLGAILLFATIGLLAQSSLQMSQGEIDAFLAGKDSYNPPKENDSQFTGGIVYIDPGYTGEKNGTIDKPFNSTADFTIKSSTAYLVKRGTSINLGSFDGAVNNVLIGAYGSGEKPVVQFSDPNSSGIRLRGNYNVLRDIHLVSKLELGSYGNSAQYCWVYNCNLDGRGAIDIPVVNWGANNKIIGNEIHHSKGEGIFAQDRDKGGVNNEYAYNHIHDINMSWYPGAGQDVAGGDGIQVSTADDLHIHHNIIDKSSAGNKFCIIVRDEAKYYSGTSFDVVIENNILYLPKQTSFGGAGIYLGESQNTIIRNNKIFYIEGDKCDLYAIYSAQSNPVIIYGNVIVNTGNDIATANGAIKAFNNTFYNVGSSRASTWQECKNNIFMNYNSNVASDNLFVSEYSADQIFVNPTTFDLKLKSGSPAIDAGVQISVSRSVDLNGIPVPQNGKMDMGALEYNYGASPSPNNAPHANAGSDQNVIAGAWVNLDASRSSDADGDKLSFTWESLDGIELSSNDGAFTSFLAPTVTAISSYEFKVIVSDGTYTDEDIITVFVEPAPGDPAPAPSETAEKLTVTSALCSSHDGNVPENTFDENMNTRWSALGENEWVQYTLSGYDTVQYLKIAWHDGNNRKAYFDVECSKDGYVWKPLLTNSQSSGLTADFERYELLKEQAKYIRIVGFGNSNNAWNSIKEVEIYGIPEIRNSTSDETNLNTDREINIYPTVVKDQQIHIETPVDRRIEKLNIVSITGTIVQSEYNLAASATLTLNELPKGNYFLQFQLDTNETQTKRLIVL